MTPAIWFALVVFVVAAFLWLQTASKTTEGFDVPADLNKMPFFAVSNGQNFVPTSSGGGGGMKGIPGALNAPREALATRKDLMELENKIATWLGAATQYESAVVGGSSVRPLTREQAQRRLELQARLTQVLRQLGEDTITDTHKAVSAEINTLRKENTGWGKFVLGGGDLLDAIHAFCRGRPIDDLLTEEEYHEFRTLFGSVLQEYTEHTQPNALEKVRQQQLEMIRKEFLHDYPPDVFFPHPAIRVGTAREFLLAALRPEQPLPTLFSVRDVVPGAESDSVTDLQSQLQDIEWKLTVTGKGAALMSRLEGLKAQLRNSNGLVEWLQQGGNGRAPTQELRRSIADLQTEVESYDPDDWVARVDTLCHRLSEAFSPADAAALGCSPTAGRQGNDYAETIHRTVCDRLRTSVPTIDPVQFNC